MNRIRAVRVSPVLDCIILQQICRKLLKALNHKATHPCCLVGWSLFTGAKMKHWVSGQSPQRRALLPCNVQTEIEPDLCLQFSLTSADCSEIHCKMHSDPQWFLLRISTPECHKLYAFWNVSVAWSGSFTIWKMSCTITQGHQWYDEPLYLSYGFFLSLYLQLQN